MNLEDTVNELAPRVLRYCRGRLRDPDAARDAAQTALVALVERWRKKGPPDSPEAFVFTVARRRAARAGLLRWRWASLESIAEPEGGSVLDPQARVQARDLHSALEKLSRKEKEALLLVVVGELSVKVTASTLGISESAVKMRLLRARTRLRELGYDS